MMADARVIADTFLNFHRDKIPESFGNFRKILILLAFSYSKGSSEQIRAAVKVILVSSVFEAIFNLRLVAPL